MLNTRSSLIEGITAKAESPKVPLIAVLFALIEGIAKAESPKVPLIAVLSVLIEGVVHIGKFFYGTHSRGLNRRDPAHNLSRFLAVRKHQVSTFRHQ